MNSENIPFETEVVDMRRSATPFEPSPFDPTPANGSFEKIKTKKAKASKQEKTSKTKITASKANEEPSSFQKEKINTINNLVDISFLEKGMQTAKATGRIVLENGGMGTGTMISADLAITNNHVIGTRAEARGAVIEFDYERDVNGIVKPVKTRKILELVSTDRRLDYAIVRVADNPGDEFGFVDIEAHVAPQPDNPKNGYPIIVQHPGGGMKQVALTDNHVLNIRKPFFHYSTDTMPGSSGSFVLNQDWRVMGLHHAGRKNGYDQSGRSIAVNEGILMSAILARLQSEGILGQESELYSMARGMLQYPGSIPIHVTNQNILWLDNSGMMVPLIQEAQEPEVALLAAAAAGVAVGAAAAHWGHVTSQNDESIDVDLSITLDLTISDEAHECFANVDPVEDLTFDVPGNTSPYELFGYIYPTISDPAYRITMKELINDTVDNSEASSLEIIVTSTGAFLAGVAAGAAAYAAGK